MASALSLSRDHPNFEYVQVPSIGAQLLVRFLQSDVTGQVSSEIFTSVGQEFHLKPLKRQAGRKYRTFFDTLPDCIPVGVARYVINLAGGVRVRAIHSWVSYM